MKKIFIFVMFLVLSIAKFAYSYDKNFAEKIIYEFCDSYVNHMDEEPSNMPTFNEQYFLKYMPKYENYGIKIEEEVTTLDKEFILEFELNENDIEYSKTFTIFKKDNDKLNNIFGYFFSPGLVDGSLECLTFYDLRLLGLQNGIKKDAKEIKDFYTKLYIKYNQNMEEYKYEDYEEYKYGNIHGTILHMEVHYDKETNIVTHIDITISV